MTTELIPSIAQELELVNERIAALQITSDEEFGEAGEFLRRLKATKGELDDSELARQKRKLYAEYKEANDQLKYWEKAIDKASKEIRGKMATYTEAKEAEARRKAEEQALQMAEVTGDETFLDVSAPTEVAPEVAGISYATVWEFEVVDPAAVPDEFKTIDTAAIRRVVQSKKGSAEIPGVKVFQKKQIRTR